MPKGGRIGLKDAQTFVKAHRKLGFRLSKVDGHQFDLSVIQTFVNEINSFNQTQVGTDVIDSIRIYYAKSKRKGAKKAERDLVIVPVKKDGRDLYTVYTKDQVLEGDPGIIANSNPCPNVCQDKRYIFCEREKPTAKKTTKKTGKKKKTIAVKKK